MNEDEDDFGAAWDRMSERADAAEQDADAGDGMVIDAGPPVRVTLVIKSDSIPVAPWAQGWEIRAGGPLEGLVTLVCEHDVDVSPVAQLAAVTGLLSTVKQAQLEVEWWAIQTRAALPGEHDDEPDLDQELADLLDEGASDSGD